MELYLRDIVEAAGVIHEFMGGVDRKSFTKDKITQSAILHQLIIIGEACAHVPHEFRQRYPDIEWTSIVGFRNIAVHVYYSVNTSIVYATAKDSVPELQGQIADILEREFDK
ncbi:DUF86 domain-containing protein [Anaerolineales bacterium HSG24]|nr:DUF86 domain-containing protein [Anaerolineales bacterium HSG24]